GLVRAVTWHQPPGAVTARAPVLDLVPCETRARARRREPRAGTGAAPGPVRAAEGWPRSRWRTPAAGGSGAAARRSPLPAAACRHPALHLVPVAAGYWRSRLGLQLGI